ncbi:hypothetical protein ABPG74_021780 [Tetrahymena malaccensis]
MDPFTGITPEKPTKGFSYFEKNPTTEQIFKRRKLSEYSQTFQNNNPHTNYHYSNNNNSSLHSSIDEYTYSMQNCDSSRSSSSNNNNNNSTNYQHSLNFINTFSNQKQPDSVIQQLSASKQNAQGEQNKNFSTSFQPNKKQSCINKSKTSLKDFLKASQNSQVLAQNLQNQEFNPSSHQENPSKTSQAGINNTNLFDYNNYFFQQLLNQNNTQQGNSQNESQTERKSLDSLLQASFQNLSINENNYSQQQQQSQSAQDSHFSQKRQSIITIPKAIKSQTPQYFQMNQKQEGISTSQMQQNQVITTSSLNNILLSKSQQDKQKARQAAEKMQNQAAVQNTILYQHINEEIEEQSQIESSYRDQDIIEEQSLEQYFKKVEAKNLEQKGRNSFLLGDKEFQQSATRGRLSLGENCPLKALKKQFPIIFPVGIPIMGQLSKLFNFEEQEEEEEQIKQSIQSISRPDNLQTQDELLDKQQQSLSSQIQILEQQDDPLFIGNLTKDERREKVEKYLEKKKNRKWKSIRYNIRKNLADQRERIQGRFVKQKNSRFNFDLLDAQYLKQLSKECDKMRLIDMSNNTDNSFDIQNHSFDS